MKLGHIRRECFDFLMHQKMRQHKQHSKTKQIQVVKRDGRCLVACTSLKVNVKQKWYFDSGSSRHMIGNKEFLTNLQPCNLESMTFSDSAKGTVIGMAS